MSHKSGFVNIIGKPNVGKSTLMNGLVGEKLSITSHKAQTTRHRIRGIVSGEDFQIVYSDTPGIIKPAYLLQDKMMDTIKGAFTDADIILFVIEVGEKDPEEGVIEKLKSCNVPVFLLLNKIDLSTQEEVEAHVAHWSALMSFKEIIPVSAKEKFNLDVVMKLLVENLPDSPPYFPKEDLTDLSERFFVSEIIREKIFYNYQKEIPYSSEVVIEAFKDEEHIVKIYACIMIERDSQKGIIIGHKGEALKKTGTAARIEISKFLGKKVYLELFVKVAPDWRKNEHSLRGFGYGGSTGGAD